MPYSLRPLGWQQPKNPFLKGGTPPFWGLLGSDGFWGLGCFGGLVVVQVWWGGRFGGGLFWGDQLWIRVSGGLAVLAVFVFFKNKTKNKKRVFCFS